MKYKVGDKVKYENGEWLFYGTITAVMDNSISPCYRLNVERMEKKDCGFAITQFEFELQACTEEVPSEPLVRKQEKEVPSEPLVREWKKAEIEIIKKYYGSLNNDELSIMLKRSITEIDEKGRQMKTKAEAEKAEAEKTTTEPEPAGSSKGKITDTWSRNLKAYAAGAKNPIVTTWASVNRRQYKTGDLSEEKVQALKAINFRFDHTSGIVNPEKPAEKPVQQPAEPEKIAEKGTTVRKAKRTWYGALEAYRRGEKNNRTRFWASDNRRKYRENLLSEEKMEALKAIDFPFIPQRKSRERENPQSKTQSQPKTQPQPQSQVQPQRQSQLTETWLRNLEAYHNGERGKNVKSWLSDVRRFYRLNTLSKEKIEALQAINFPFPNLQAHQVKNQTSAKEKLTDTWLRNLEAYRKGDRNEKVKSWLSDIRKFYREDKLSEAKIKALQAINFRFPDEKTDDTVKPEGKITDSWLGHLEAYRKGEIDEKVRSWINNIRKFYKQNKLSPEKLDMLNAINFPLIAGEKGVRPNSVQKWEDKWIENLNAFVAGERSGRIRAWMSDNKKNYRDNKLSEEKFEKLLEVNFPFDGDSLLPESTKPVQATGAEQPDGKYSAWDRNLEAYLRGEKGNIIWSWATKNRRDYRNGTLPESKYNKLVAINFTFAGAEPLKNKKSR